MKGLQERSCLNALCVVPASTECGASCSTRGPNTGAQMTSRTTGSLTDSRRTVSARTNMGFGCGLLHHGSWQGSSGDTSCRCSSRTPRLNICFVLYVFGGGALLVLSLVFKFTALSKLIKTGIGDCATSTHRVRCPHRVRTEYVFRTEYAPSTFSAPSTHRIRFPHRVRT